MLKKWLISIGLLVAFPLAFAGNNQLPGQAIKVALYDNPGFYLVNSWNYSNYEQVYLAGVRAAVAYFRKKNVPITYQTFFYGSGSMAVFGKLKAVKAWKPDMIVGPHYSNDFFELNGQFKHILVLSPYASDSTISSLPKNYQTAAVMDPELISILQKLMTSRLHSNRLLDLSQIDCKDCVDFSRNLQQLKGIQLKTFNVYGDDVSKIPLKKALNSVTNNTVILLNVASYLLGQQIVKKMAFMAPKTHFRFIDFLDNWGKRQTASYMRSNVVIYRMFPDINSIQEDAFNNYHVTLNNNNFLGNQASFMIFNTIRSAVSAYLKYGHQVKGNTVSQKIRNAYLKAITINKYWYKIRYYFVVKVDSHGEHKIARISW